MATGYDQTLRDLSDCFKAREVARLVYFHCDHFEPWQSFSGSNAFDERHAEHLRMFADDLNLIDYARKLTLFYKPNNNYFYTRDPDLIRAADDDLVGFGPRAGKDAETARANMKYLTDNCAHELQLHIHHEGYTYNTSHKDPHIVEYFKSERARALDATGSPWGYGWRRKQSNRRPTSPSMPGSSYTGTGRSMVRIRTLA
jgi:hypothetical protein